MPECSEERWTHKHGSSQTAFYRLLSGECVVVIICNYNVTEFFTRISVSSTCTSGLVIHVENRVAPFKSTVGQSSGLRVPVQVKTALVINVS